MNPIKTHPSLLRSLVVCAALSSSAFAAAPVSLANGAPMDIAPDPSMPRELIMVAFPGGPAMVPPKMQGLTQVLEYMLKEGPSTMDREAFKEKLFVLGGTLSFYSSPRGFIAVVNTPPESAGEMLELLRQTLQSPRLDEKSFAEARAKAASVIALRDDDMAQFLGYLGPRDAFSYHPDTFDGAGSKRTLEAITLGEIKKQSKNLMAMNHAIFGASGPMSAGDVKGTVEKALFAGKATPKYSNVALKAPDVKKYERKDLKVTVVNRAGATDNQVMFIFPEVIRFDSPEFANAVVAHRILGGGLTGRLGETLRVKRGLTYHASSGLSRNTPSWSVRTFGGVEQTPGLIAGVSEVIQSFKAETLNPAEVTESATQASNDYLKSLELPRDRLMRRMEYRLFGRDPAFVEALPAEIAKVSPEAVKSFVDSKIRAKGGYLYLMGDKDKLVPMLEKQGISKGKIKVVEQGQVM
jgi:zinc protease